MFKPIGNRIVVKVPKIEEVTSGGLHIVGGIAEQMVCDVISVGDGEYSETGVILPLRIVVGDKIVLQKGFGQEITYEGEDYLITTEPEVIGIV
jgi:chaperonin GroES